MNNNYYRLYYDGKQFATCDKYRPQRKGNGRTIFHATVALLVATALWYWLGG